MLSTCLPIRSGGVFSNFSPMVNRVREVGEVIQREFGISQPAVSQHLKVLRDNGFTLVRADGARRLYAVEAQPLQEVDRWLDHFRQLWTRQLDAVGT